MGNCAPNFKTNQKVFSFFNKEREKGIKLLELFVATLIVCLFAINRGIHMFHQIRDKSQHVPCTCLLLLQPKNQKLPNKTLDPNMFIAE